MSKFCKVLAVSFTVFCLSIAGPAKTAKRSKAAREVAEITTQAPAVLWREPADISSRNLYYGPGGKAHQPRDEVYSFDKEDMDGSNPKFDVIDSSGVKWKVKLGEEARPETVASRLVWAVGYFTNEDYFMPVLRVKEMPRLRRGRKLVTPDGIVYGVRLKRHLSGEKKLGEWQWMKNPFTGTRELNGLRVLMAVINNWDLKDENNDVYEVRAPQGPELLYVVKDLGSSFGTAGFGWTRRGSKGNLKAYTHSKFIRQATPEYVDFYVPARAALDHAPALHEFKMRLRMRWIGRHIPRTDARWMGDLLARLSAAQIRDAFRAAGYTPEQVEGFSRVVERRIAQLEEL
jgi:hypothetical protein